MMLNWWKSLLLRLERGPVVMVTVLRTAGSTPREAGARMLISADGFNGTIGGGVLEYGALADARALLARHAQGELASWHRETRTLILGPDAGQCCGGQVELLFEVLGAQERKEIACFGASGQFTRTVVSGDAARFTSKNGDAFRFRLECHADIAYLAEDIMPVRRTLHIYGAGHVARALVHVLDGSAFEVHWIDIAAERFPATPKAEVHAHIIAEPHDYAATALPGGVHLVMTHSHPLDEAICAALLRRDDAAFVGLIGSATKRARFVQRFRRAGFADAAIAKLVCPIGLPGIAGKAPATIAIAVAAQLLSLRLDALDEKL